MDLTLLGTGSPQPSPLRAGPSNHLVIGKSSLMVDCGNGAVVRMAAAGLDAKDLDYIFLTHMHSDHTIDLAHVLITGWIRYRTKPITIVGPVQTREFVSRVIHAYEFDIKLRKLHRRVGDDVMDVRVLEVGDRENVETDGWRATAIEVDHGYVKPALGFVFEDESAKLMISGDTTGCDAVRDASAGADLLLHELMRASPESDPHDADLEQIPELRRRIIQSHTCPHMLGRLATEADVPKVVTTHLPHVVDNNWIDQVIRADYRGELVAGEDLMTIRVGK